MNTYRHISTICGLLLCASAIAQPSTENYILSRTRMSNGMQTSIQYYDGLGIPYESAVENGQGKYLLSLTEPYGLSAVKRSWLPAVSTESHLTPSSLKEAAVTSNLRDSSPYTETTFDAAATAQPTYITGPGREWTSHNIKKSYLVNTSDMPLACRDYRVSPDGTLRDCGMYKNGQLSVTKTTDEDGDILYEFKDKSGRMVLTRRIGYYFEQSADTYTVYDHRGNPAWILTPEFQNNPDTLLYAYHCRYDGLGRCYWKRAPGCEPVTTEYDRAGNIALTQDGRQRSIGVKSFFLYDGLGRITVTGTCAASSLPEPPSCVFTADYTGSGQYGGYASHVALGEVELHEVTYYDNHDFLQLSENSGFAMQTQATQLSGYDSPAANETGHVTGRHTWILKHNTGLGVQSLLSAVYHDIYGREVRTISQNHLGGTETISTAYSVSGKPLRQRHVHTASGRSTITEETENTYDDADRLLTTTHSVNGGTPVTLASYQYSDLGRMSRKIVGGMEDTRYSYNVRGWTTWITGSRFTESLTYNESSWNQKLFSRRYGGDIASVRWRCGNTGNLWRMYNYIYDKFGRLEMSVYSDTDNDNISHEYNGLGMYGEMFAHDLNGNITYIERYGLHDDNQYGKIDCLNLEYEGNQLVRATDDVDGPFYAGAMHFRDGADEDEEYEYDENGNMTKDLNSNISLVEYNSLNLPSVITFSNNMDNITNIYTSTGTKLRSISSKYAYLLEDPLVDLYAPTDNQAAEPMLSVDEHPDFVVVDNDEAVAYVQEEDNALAEAADDSNDEAVISEEDAPSRCKRFWGNIGLEESKITDYCANVIYQDGKRMLLVDGGYVTFNDNDSLSYGEGCGGACYHYYLKDHLGNVRVVFNDQDSIEQVNDYYAYGGIMATSWGGDTQRYKYNGKELETVHGLDWYDYGARWMSPVLGRFTTPDPKQWDTPQGSSFAYCDNNPIKFVDPDGKFPSMWQAQLSRWVYNAFHQTKAGPIHTNDDVKDSKYQYTYDTYSSTGDGEFVITCNYKFDTTWTQDVQNVGNGIALAGYAATLTGAGAEVGAPTAAVGNTISNVGAAAEISLDLINGDAGNSAKEVIYYLAERSIEKVIDKLMPGNAGPKAKEVVKSFKNKVIGETTGNSILGKDFDLGKSIVSQGANLKAKIVEKIIDTTLDKEKK